MQGKQTFGIGVPVLGQDKYTISSLPRFGFLAVGSGKSELRKAGY